MIKESNNHSNNNIFTHEPRAERILALKLLVIYSVNFSQMLIYGNVYGLFLFKYGTILTVLIIATRWPESQYPKLDGC